MKVLVTAGATRTSIDKVRAITNIFGGRTGTDIANYFARNKQNQVTLITSNTYITEEIQGLRIVSYKTFFQLAEIMKQEILSGQYDLIVHSAAVSDYQVEGVYILQDEKLIQIDSSTKVSSSHKEIFLKMVPTFKIVDKIRNDWQFQGKLVKFKLQVDMSYEDLIQVAEKSRQSSSADIIIANCLEWSKLYAYVLDGQIEKVSRKNIAQAIERRVS